MRWGEQPGRQPGGQVLLSLVDEQWRERRGLHGALLALVGDINRAAADGQLRLIALAA